MAKITETKEQQEEGTTGNDANENKVERTPISDGAASENESAGESRRPSESKLQLLRRKLADLVEKHLQLCVTLYGDDQAGIAAKGDGPRTHCDEDASAIEDWVIPEMSEAELASEIYEYREQVGKLKCEIREGARTESIHDRLESITCFKDLYTHPDGAPLHLLRDLPGLVGYRLTLQDSQQYQWQHHPLVREERMRRHLWRLQNDTTGEYAALLQQTTPNERPARFALLKEMEQAEAGLQAAIVADIESDRLTAQQRQAIAALRDGNSFEEVGVKLAVDDATMESWQKKPNFAAEIAFSIEEKLASVRHMSLRLADKAIRCVEQSIHTDRCPQSALAIMRAVGAMNRQLTQSGLDPYVAMQEQAESGEPTAEDGANAEFGMRNAESNGCKSATWNDWRSMENENGVESATFAHEQANEQKNRSQSATWRWEEEVARVTILDLPENQRCSAISLLAGESMERAAIDGGTTVDDLRQWLRADGLFQAALNCKFRDKVRHLFCRLLALADSACEILEEAISAGQTQIAIRFLRGLALM